MRTICLPSVLHQRIIRSHIQYPTSEPLAVGGRERTEGAFEGLNPLLRVDSTQIHLISALPQRRDRHDRIVMSKEAKVSLHLRTSLQLFRGSIPQPFCTSPTPTRSLHQSSLYFVICLPDSVVNTRISQGSLAM